MGTQKIGQQMMVAELVVLASDFTSKNLIVKNNQARWGGGISIHAPGSYLENIVSENN